MASFNNNAGIHHMKCGRWYEASSCFRVALQTLRGQPLNVQEVPEINLTMETLWTSSLVACDARCGRDDDWYESMSGATTNIQFDHNTLMVCPTVFRLSTRTTRTNSDEDPTRTSFQQETSQDVGQENDLEDEHTNILAAAILYNMSLARHVGAIMSQRLRGSSRRDADNVNNDVSFAKAARLYGMAAALAQRAPSLLSERSRHPLLLAIFSNWAHASFQVFDWTTCDYCYQMLQLIVSIPTSQITTGVTGIFPWHGIAEPEHEQEQQQIVFMNQFFMQNRMRSAPAA